MKGKINTSKLKRILKETDTFRTKLGKKTGTTESSTEIIREDRDRGH
jgi:hypothetical protein